MKNYIVNRWSELGLWEEFLKWHLWLTTAGGVGSVERKVKCVAMSNDKKGKNIGENREGWEE